MANWPFGHSDFSSTSTCPPWLSTNEEAYGSGAHAPASCPESNSAGTSLLLVGDTVTSPPPATDDFSPLLVSHVRSATSWVLPSWGLATCLPLRSAAELMPSLTTSSAPAEAAPATIRTASPLLCP